jgi:RND family efflux transporter MFP subunit
MKRPIIIIVIIAAMAAGAYSLLRGGGASEAAQSDAGPAGRRGGQGGGGFGGPGGGGRGGVRPPMTVDLAAVTRADLSQQFMVVGNLIGLATVETTPKVNGRLASVAVRLGDRVSRGQQLAKIEDSELLEQIKQAEASFAVAAATIRQREADMGAARTNLDRSRNLYDRQLLPRQTFDDAEARYQAAEAQVDLAQAQHQQSKARIDELKIDLSNTVITSPVNGFIGKRTLDQGAWVTPNSVFLSVVDISSVRIVANVVERDLRRVSMGLPARVEVDAFPGEKFTGRVANIAPVLDPATRTAQVEVEIPNSDFRLKPGMYARVNFTIGRRDNTLVVPVNAIVDYQGKKGVFQPHKGAQGDVVSFKPVEVGLADETNAEVVSGLSEGERIITTGAAALREGDRVVLVSQPDGTDGPTGGSRRGGAAGSSLSPSVPPTPSNPRPRGSEGARRGVRPLNTGGNAS